MQYITKYAEISGEVTLEYVERGDPNGVPVIFLHGVTDSWRSFELLLPHLPDWIRAFALSQRGHGDSTRPESYDPDDFAADIEAFMDLIGLDKAVVVGHSMGSFMAQRFAISYPRRVSALVLIGSFPGFRDNRGVTEFYESEISRLEDPVPESFAREFQESTVVGESLKVPARVWKAAFEGLVKSDNTDKLGRIEAPTLLLWGESDAYFSRGDQEKLLDGIEGSKLVVYPGTGHTPHWEDPEKTAADLLNFIEAKTGVERRVSFQFL
jgi:pimeloyl-ACP methyl ester carboxylesterase